jgi:hypothetical protein
MIDVTRNSSLYTDAHFVLYQALTITFRSVAGQFFQGR